MSRPYLAQLHRQGKTIWKRNYASFTNAARRATEIAVQYGEPGDVVEFSHNESGLQLGTLTVHAGGSLTLQWSETTTRLQQVVDSYRSQT